MKRVAILGSTGSIGCQTLEVVSQFPDEFQVVGLGGGRNNLLLAKQVEQFRPKLVFFMDGELPTDVAYERVSLQEMAAASDVDVVVMATSGKAGLSPTLSAIRAGKTVALANKEVLVMAGGIVMSEALEHGTEILPLDSEHSAVWQCLRGEHTEQVARILLTASGGPFRKWSKQQLATVTPEKALDHPTWRMGKKVTIDSATLMNKGMEVIEAHWLFNMPFEQIDVVIHSESIVHSMVEFVDGSVKAQLSQPDMRLPIQCALTYPNRFNGNLLPGLDWRTIKSLSFDVPDTEKFPCLKLALESGERGGTHPVVLCASDEVAVELFLSHRIGFLDIASLVTDALEQWSHHGSTATTVSLDEILAADAWARNYAKNWRPRR